MVSPLVNSNKDQVDKLANLDILVASLSDISTENARGVRSKEMFEVEPARGDRPIFQTVWDLQISLTRKSLSDFLHLWN